MERLLPPPIADVSAYDAHRPEDPHAPWLRINMVTTLDGRITDASGSSGGLGGDGDLASFRALRALADAILVGGGTARSEDYGPHRVHESVADRRRADGRDEPAPIVLVSGSLGFDPAHRLFTEAARPTIVLTHGRAPADRRARLEEVADVEVVGDDEVDLALGLRRLRSRGLAHVLCEGGPGLNSALLAAGLVDELCLTIAPQLAGGDDTRIAQVTTPVGARLAFVGHVGDELLVRHLIERSGPASGRGE